MPRYRMKFSKLGDLRFISHLDLSHTFERSARRSGILLAFSQGFHPHPKIAFATALSVGTTSESEYVDIETEIEFNPEELVDKLNSQLPKGIEITEAVQIPENSPALMAQVSAARYKVVIEGLTESASIREALGKLMSKETIFVMKKSKSGIKEIDIKPHIMDLSLGDDGSIEMLLATGSQGMIKPDDLFAALQKDGLVPDGATIVKCHRIAILQKKGEQFVPML